MKRQGEIVFDTRLNPSADRAIAECCASAKALEDAGDYEAARDALSSRWRGAGHRPALDGLSPAAKAELLIRCGALTGWLGSSKQVGDAQESAKNLITEGMEIFEALGDRARVAEARLDLALCYWRQGAYDEGRVAVRVALDHLTEEHRELRGRAVLRWANIELFDGRAREALNVLADGEALFESLNDYLQGCFHGTRGAAYMKVLEAGGGDYADKAFVELTAASYHFDRAGHTRFQARTENNLGFLLAAVGRYAEAHEHLHYARGLFVGLRDRGSVAQVDETRARAFIAEQWYDKAELIISLSIATLEQGGEQDLLAEALTTGGVTLVRLGRHEEAKARLRRAVEVAEVAGASKRAAHAALTMIEELHGHMDARELCATYETADRLAGPDVLTEMLMRMRDCASRLPQLVRELLTPRLPCNLDEEVRLLEREYIEEALRVSGGRKTPAARLLGFKHPNSLQSRIESRHKDLKTERQRRLRSIITKRNPE